MDFTKTNNSDNKNAWINEAERLTEFVVTNLVNRDDAYGKYRSLDDRDHGTALTVESEPTESVIQDHFRSEDRGQLIGLHTTSPENTSKWMVIDIDHHGEPDPDREDTNELATTEIYEDLVASGFEPLLFKSNGRGGFHIWIIFDSPVSTESVYQFGNSIVAHWRSFGLNEAPEVFPKQPSLDGRKFGNWVRLPGLHHTYDFYTEVWDGEKWLSGQAAVDQICGHKPAPADLIESVEIEPVIEEPKAPSKPKVDSDDDRPIKRILSRLTGVQRSGAGYTALCPNHHDTEQSLSIGENKKGDALLHCFAGCENEQIVETIGLEMRDLFANTPDGTDRELRHRHPRVGNDKKNNHLDLAALHESALDKTTLEKTEDLGILLGVSINSLLELEVAWSEPDGCWLFPERDHQKRIIGLLKRFPDGTKRFVSGGQRGLYIPRSFSADESQIIVVEGGSDTAAAFDLGWNVIGRPSAAGGVSQLIQLLQTAKGRIYVLGDNDAKRDGTWPGMRGAEQAAERLGAVLRGDVFVTSVPLNFKDVRDLLHDQGEVK